MCNFQSTANGWRQRTSVGDDDEVAQRFNGFIDRFQKEKRSSKQALAAGDAAEFVRTIAEMNAVADTALGEFACGGEFFSKVDEELKRELWLGKHPGNPLPNEQGELVAVKQEMMETEAEERWAKPDAAMPVLRDVKKEELEEEKKITERRAKQLRLQMQTGVAKVSIPSAPDPLLEEMDIALLKMWNCAAMTTVYNELSTAWQRRLQNKARDRSMVLTTHERERSHRSRG